MTELDQWRVLGDMDDLSVPATSVSLVTHQLIHTVEAVTVSIAVRDPDAVWETRMLPRRSFVVDEVTLSFECRTAFHGSVAQSADWQLLRVQGMGRDPDGGGEGFSREWWGETWGALPEWLMDLVIEYRRALEESPLAEPGEGS